MSAPILIFKPTLEVNGKIKGNVDAELVLHAMIEFKNYDKSIIVSGDGDFHCLISYLVKNNKLLRLIIPNKNKYSLLLKGNEFHRYRMYMNDLRVKLFCE